MIVDVLATSEISGDTAFILSRSSDSKLPIISIDTFVRFNFKASASVADSVVN